MFRNIDVDAYGRSLYRSLVQMFLNDLMFVSVQMCLSCLSPDVFVSVQMFLSQSRCVCFSPDVFCLNPDVCLSQIC